MRKLFGLGMVLCMLAEAAFAGLPGFDPVEPPWNAYFGVDVDEAGNILQSDQPAFVLHPRFPADPTYLECAPGVTWDCFQRYVNPNSIGENGWVVGNVCAGGPGILLYCATHVWDLDGRLIATLIEDDTATATDVNLSGRIVGIADFGSPVYWEGLQSSVHYLPEWVAGQNHEPMAINDAGTIAGNVEGSPQRALVWTDAGGGSYVIAALGELPGDDASEARAINEDGWIVGRSIGPNGNRAVLWRPEGPGYRVDALPIPFLGGACFRANDVNDLGRIVGICTPSGGDPLGVVWKVDGGTIDFLTTLDPLPFRVDSNGRALNNSGLIAGHSNYGLAAWQLDEEPEPLSTPGLGAVSLGFVAALLAGVAFLATFERRRSRLPGSVR